MKESHRLASSTGIKSRTAKNIATLASGAVAMTGASQAAIIHMTTPITIDTSSANGTTADWDVDGLNGVDFQLNILKFTTTTTIRLNSGGTFDGRGFINNAGGTNGQNLSILPNNFSVQQTPTGLYGWGAGNLQRNLLSQTTGTSGAILRMPDHTSGNAGNVGFRFDGGSGFQYGWASITATTNNSSIVINEWAYNDAVGGAIMVGQVPEPSVSTLGLLAAGAAGLRRRRKKQS